jgi:hypothetical protein
MKKILLFWAVLLVSQLGPAAADAPVKLRFSLPEGTELVFKSQSATASRLRITSDPDNESTSKVNQTLRYRLLEVSPEGEMTWERSIVSGTMSSTSDGKEVEHKLSKGTVKFKLTPLGKVTLIRDPERTGEEDDLLTSVMSPTSELDLALSGLFLPLPEAPVKPGDSWEAEQMISFLPEGLTATEAATPDRIKIKSRLVEFTRQGDRPCARISTQFSLPISDTIAKSGGPEMEISGKVSADIDWYFDYSRSRTLAVSAVTQFATKFSSKDSDSSVPDISMTMKSNTKTSLVEKER